MRQFHLKPLLIVVGLLISFTVAALPASAQVHQTSAQAVKTSQGPQQGGLFQIKCNSALVTLNGHNTPSITCPPPGDSGQVQCGTSGGMRLYWDSNYQGWEICFTGTGFANMTDYCYWGWRYGIFTCWSWNDQVSSAYAGCHKGYYYVDINANPDRGYDSLYEKEYTQLFGTGQTSHVPNDSLSSIQLNTSRSSC